MSGVVGERHRTDATAIALAVIPASRLEIVTRVHKVWVFISQFTSWDWPIHGPLHIFILVDAGHFKSDGQMALLDAVKVARCRIRCRHSPERIGALSRRLPTPQTRSLKGLRISSRQNPAILPVRLDDSVDCRHRARQLPGGRMIDFVRNAAPYSR
jgi:hypothetical protein